MLAVYLLYLAVWGLLTLLLSLLAKQEQTALALLTALWLAGALLLPSLAVNNTARAIKVRHFFTREAEDQEEPGIAAGTQAG